MTMQLTPQSSAAFVVSSVIMFLTANGLTEGITKGDVVRLAIASEHRMGLRTGGMDVSTFALRTFVSWNVLWHTCFSRWCLLYRACQRFCCQAASFIVADSLP